MPQHSFRARSSAHDGDRVILLNPGTPSEGQQDNPSTARSFSLRKVMNSLSAKRTHSLPVTPVGTNDKVSSPVNQLESLPTTSVSIHIYSAKYVPIQILDDTLSH